MNRKAILELAEHLEHIRPSSFNMNSFNSATEGEIKGKITLRHRCGTTCCIAGEKILLDGGFILKGRFFVEGSEVRAARYAQRELGLPNDEVFFDFSIKTPKQAAGALRALIGAK